MNRATDRYQKAATKPTMLDYKRHILVCVGPRCTQNNGGQRLYDSLKEKFKTAGLDEGRLRVKRSRVTCFGACKGDGPLVCVQPDGTWYYNVTFQNMDRIIKEHLTDGAPVTELIFHQGPSGV